MHAGIRQLTQNARRKFLRGNALAPCINEDEDEFEEDRRLKTQNAKLYSGANRPNLYNAILREFAFVKQV
jgi:hypothetical protein